MHPIVSAILAACGGGLPLFIDSHNVTSTGIIVKGSGAATARLTVESTGTLLGGAGGLVIVTPAFDDSREWAGGATPGDYHVRVTATGDTGDMGGLSLNTWYACTSNRSWDVSISGGSPGSNSVNLTIEFSNDGGSTVFQTFSGIISLIASIS